MTENKIYVCQKYMLLKGYTLYLLNYSKLKY